MVGGRERYAVIVSLSRVVMSRGSMDASLYCLSSGLSWKRKVVCLVDLS